MTTLAVIGDIHAHYRNLERVLARVGQVGVDGILLVGDLGSFDLSLAHLRTPDRDARYLKSVARVLDLAGSVGVPVAWVPGNHDLRELPGEGNVDGGQMRIGELAIAGIGGAGPARFGFSYEWDEDEIRARTVPACDVLLVHCPPADTPIDRVATMGMHVGSEAIRERAAAHVGFLVCGHIHESPGAVIIERCLCVNAGGLGEPYGKPQVAFIRREGGVDTAWHEDLVTGQVERYTGP